MLARAWNLLLAAAENVVRNGVGYAVAGATLVLGATLLVSGVAISEGLKAQALASVKSGATLYVTWDTFGRDSAIASDWIERIGRIDGIVAVVPRIVGRVPVGGRSALLIGVPLERLKSREIPWLGALPASPDEVLVGSELARAAGLSPGMKIVLEGAARREFSICGEVQSTSALWSAKAVVCDLPQAARLFGEDARVSDLLVDTRPGYEARVADAIAAQDARLRVQTRPLIQGYVARGMSLREGVFAILFALVLALAIVSFAVVSYLGHTPRRREIAVRKSEGWTTLDVLSMVAFENALISLLAAGLALSAALFWVRVLRAPLIAPFFLPDLPLFPQFEIPSRFTPLPVLIAFLFSITVTMSGSILATWRTASTRPAEVLR